MASIYTIEYVEDKNHAIPGAFNFSKEPVSFFDVAYDIGELALLVAKTLNYQMDRAFNRRPIIAEEAGILYDMQQELAAVLQTASNLLTESNKGRLK
jgi:hypothetical protein